MLHMSLLRLAMRRPLSVAVALVGLAMAGTLAVRRMPRDILPTLGIPTIYVAQPYGGMDPAQMEGFIAYYYEYHFLYINGIEHVESKSIQGVSILKLQFHPGTDMAAALAETINYVNRSRAFMPPGTVPPFVMRYDVGSVPVGNLVFSSETRSLAEIQDVALNRVRPIFATLPGVSAPPPLGSSIRSIVVRVDPDRLRAYNLSPDEVVAALASTQTITPSGSVRIGELIPMVPLNSIVRSPSELEEVPLRPGTQPAVFIRDIGTVEDTADIATGFALVNGRRTIYNPVNKRASASTLEVVRLVKENLPRFQAMLPDDVKVTFEFDQSPYVTRAIANLSIEGLLGALLTGLMVLLFLRDVRSALVVVLNIPIAILAALVGLWATGQTVNIMTLGGLALAVGILVDEATVAIEHIHTHLAQGKTVARAAFDATLETARPRLLAMLSVLAVFIPAFFMVGAGRALFVPLALAVGFAMIASYLLSSTFVPVLATWIVRPRSAAPLAPAASRYGGLVDRLARRRKLVLLVYAAAAAAPILMLGPQIGTEIFPDVDVGQFQLRLRAPTGTRIEVTEKLTQQTLETIKAAVGADNVEATMGFVGTQPANAPVNTIFLWTGGPDEAALQVQVKRGVTPIGELKDRLRARFAAELPQVRFSFEPSDIVSRVMSFGASTPVEVAVSGPALAANQEHADKIRLALGKLPALRDVQIKQSLEYPTIQVNVDRERAGLLGIKTADVSRSLVAATWSSRFLTPIYWSDPGTGVSYQVQVEVPQARMSSIEAIQNIPIASPSGQPLLLRSVADVTPGVTVSEYERYNMQRTITVTANVSGGDLGGVDKDIAGALDEVGAPPPKTTVAVRGQIAPLRELLAGLRQGLLLTVAVIFLLLAASFQSLRLSLVVVSTVPAVLAGVVIALWVTGTSLNVQSFMGAIMAVGVAVANAVLLVTFADRSRRAGADAIRAAIDSARSRVRPILMTSVAMIAGMMPVALGLGEGGEQTAPLGRAVVGGLACATVATLLVLPAAFSLLAGRHVRSGSLDPEDPESPHYNAIRGHT